MQQISDSFFARTSVRALLHTFDMLPDTLVWVKDSAGRVMFGNSCFVHQFGASRLEELIGKNDYDFSPPVMAKQFIDDDRQVLRGQRVQERLELNILRTGEICWFITNKYPLKADDGEIIGTYGMTRRIEKANIPLTAVQQLEASIDYIRGRLGKTIEIVELARASCVSVSVLERRFKKYLHKSPKQFINETRLEYARRLLLDTDDSVANIANACGFADPSYFTRLYTRQFGCSPTVFRRQRAEQ